MLYEQPVVFYMHCFNHFWNLCLSKVYNIYSIKNMIPDSYVKALPFYHCGKKYDGNCVKCCCFFYTSAKRTDKRIHLNFVLNVGFPIFRIDKHR